MQGTTPTPIGAYPVHVEGHLDRPSRWLWLLKWLLVIPHYLVLAVLWLGLVLSSLMAFVNLLFTGRYPRGLFEFNVGVLRWSWRVGFYAFTANGTDRYPPFTFADVPDYPARLTIDYPEQQRRGLRLIGWWLAGIPQYLIASVFIGGSVAVGWTAADRSWGGQSWPGVIGILVCVGVIVLLFRGEYPRSVFDLVLGLNRWVMRVLAYAALMTPEYPPFRVDSGEMDPAGTLDVSNPVRGTTAPGEPMRWSAGSIAAGILAAVAGVIAVVAIILGGGALAFTQTSRDAGGYLMSSSHSYSTSTHALVSPSYGDATSNDWFVARELLGRVRIQVTGDQPLFVGIGPKRAVDGYLAGTAYAESPRLDASTSHLRVHPGGSQPTPPSAQTFWSASAAGRGPLTVSWTPRAGSWRIVVMNPTGSARVAADVSIGAKFPHLLAIAIGVFGAGILLMLGSGAVIYQLARRRR